MPDINIKKIIMDLKEELKKKYPDFDGIYLFGSRVRDDYKEDSDYDIILAFGHNVDRRLKKEISSIIYRYELDNNIILDEHVYRHSDILNPATPFRQNVLKEGRYYAG
jgi:predicted nucleotidyltransferase